MRVEIKKSPAVAIANAVIALAILGLVVHHDITWPMAMGALGLLLTPSIAKAKRASDAKGRKDDPPPPTGPSSGPPPMIITPIMLLVFASCFPADKTVEAAGAYEAQQQRCVAQYSTRKEIDACRDKVKAAWATDAGKDAADDR